MRKATVLLVLAAMACAGVVGCGRPIAWRRVRLPGRLQAQALGTTIIRSEEDFVAVGGAPDEVDFGREVLIIHGARATRGPVRSGITGVVAHGDTVHVNYRVEVPGHHEYSMPACRSVGFTIAAECAGMDVVVVRN